MNLTKELLTNLIQVVIDHPSAATDVLWRVTALRTDIFCMFKQLKLYRPGHTKEEMVLDKQLAMDILCDYANVLASFPAEIKYTDNKVETPRINALNRTFEVVQGLESDDDTWNSAQELVRLVATNADSEHQRLDYAVLMGIMLKIFELLDIDIGGICQDCIIELTTNKAKA